MAKTGHDAFDILKQASLESAQKDTADFCHRTLIERYLNANQALPTDASKLSTRQLEARADAINKEDTPWKLSLVSTEKAQRLSIVESLQPSDPWAKDAKPRPDWIDPERFFEKPAPNSYAGKAAAALSAPDMKPNEAAAAMADPSQIVGACMIENAFAVAECTRALTSIKSRMLPKKNDVTDVKLWQRVVGSNVDDEGLRQAALNVARSLKEGSGSQSHVFEDIQQGFVKAGFSESEATEKTWDTLGLMSNHGPNIGHYVRKFESGSPFEGSQKSYALGFIASAMAAIDTKRAASGQSLYSYPSNVKTSCSNSKPYHFWMSAYLARTLVREDHLSPESAAQYTYLAEKGYQIHRQAASGGRQGLSHAELDEDNALIQRVFNEKSLSPTQQVIRMDLAQSASGAFYGANSATTKTTKTYDTDKALFTLIKNAGKSDSSQDYLGAENVEIYKNWMMIFSPQSAFQELKSQNQAQR